MIRRRACAVLLWLPLLGGCRDSQHPPLEPDWAEVEHLLASDARKDRGEAVRILLLADEDRPGTLRRLAEMPEQALPALRHYTAAAILVTLLSQPGALEHHRHWTPSRRTLELLVAGLEDERSLPVGGGPYWDLPIGRFCQDALELLTGVSPPPRPINVLPAPAEVARWRTWWEEGHPYLCLDSDRGIWVVDDAARHLGIPLGEP